jgi:addiction module RelB/DinJ family antitoxin
MATTATFQAKIDPKKKAMADEIYKSLGTTTAEAFRIFVQKSIDANGFPFALTLSDNPRPETLHAYDEADKLAKMHTTQKYTSVKEMMNN